MPTREFASELRRLIDRSGLSLAAVADRTGHSTASWERYLDGRLPAPRSAVVALAEVTGTDAGRLTAMWEHAERARSSSAPPPDGAPAEPPPPPSPLPPSTPPPPPPRQGSGASRVRRAALLLTGILGALLVIAAAVLLTDLGRGATGATGATGGTGPAGGKGGGTQAAGTPTATPSSTPGTPLPAGVKCTGTGCTGQDPETMGCGGTFATTVARAQVGPAGGQVELRHSRTCGAAWARITGAVPGDTIHVTAAGAVQNAVVDADAAAYTPMVAVTRGADATACATLRSGERACAAGHRPQ
ncbi:helix-turn-helix domain-containing protein [Streptomyces vilmorinianum]|uniref:helix-turn-helix domain-containing protein n=1 Tax=Streptomyces vilmorinianum TaxID=3051092 RepID=UPI0010FB90B7|nr:XRE family transcriptional regulator [Streptomyces vilmorinianum]